MNPPPAIYQHIHLQINTNPLKAFKLPSQRPNKSNQQFCLQEKSEVRCHSKEIVDVLDSRFAREIFLAMMKGQKEKVFDVAEEALSWILSVPKK